MGPSAFREAVVENCLTVRKSALILPVCLKRKKLVKLGWTVYAFALRSVQHFTLTAQLAAAILYSGKLSGQFWLQSKRPKEKH